MCRARFRSAGRPRIRAGPRCAQRPTLIILERRIKRCQACRTCLRPGRCAPTTAAPFPHEITKRLSSARLLGAHPGVPIIVSECAKRLASLIRPPSSGSGALGLGRRRSTSAATRSKPLSSEGCSSNQGGRSVDLAKARIGPVALFAGRRPAVVEESTAACVQALSETPFFPA